MVHTDPTGSSGSSGLKQVEFNTIASSFGGLSSQVSALHKHLLTIDAYPAAATSIIKADVLRQSSSTSSLAKGLAAAHQAYAKEQSNDCLDRAGFTLAVDAVFPQGTLNPRTAYSQSQDQVLPVPVPPAAEA